jgi:carboxylesterase type B
MFNDRVSKNSYFYDRHANIMQLRACGFLAETTVENESVANTGLHDQYAPFERAHNYICLLGGDPDNVSAWGESVGAGFIYRLLTQEGGAKDPLFRRAIVQSPAFEDKFDRNCTMEQDF